MGFRRPSVAQPANLDELISFSKDPIKDSLLPLNSEQTKVPVITIPSMEEGQYVHLQRLIHSNPDCPGNLPQHHALLR
jgi:hypothetical protein